jgi:hypothetical protein
LLSISNDITRAHARYPFLSIRRPSPAQPVSLPPSGTSTPALSDSLSDTSTEVPVPHRRVIPGRLRAIATISDNPQSAPSLPSTTSCNVSDPPLPSNSVKLLSPKITLTTDHKPGGPRPQSSRRILPSLDLPKDGTFSSPTSPITLLSPKPIPSQASSSFEAVAEDYSHGSVLTRLTYVLHRSHPEWNYHPGLVDIITPIYAVYAHIRLGELTDIEPPDDEGTVEEQVFTALESLIGDLIGGLSDGGNVSMLAAQIGQRVVQISPAYHAWLCTRQLDPASPLYTYRWITSLLARDLPLSYILPIWDMLLSEPPRTTLRSTRVETLVDLCTTILLIMNPFLLRRRRHAPSRDHTMWDDLSSDEDDIDGDLIRHLQMLRSIPVSRLGGMVALRDVFLQVKEERHTNPTAIPASAPLSYIDRSLVNPSDIHARLSSGLSSIATAISSTASGTWIGATTTLSRAGLGRASSVREGTVEAAVIWSEDENHSDKPKNQSAAPSSVTQACKDGGIIASSTISLQERLANLAKTPAASLGHVKASSLSGTLPRPLLLSKSARRVSSASHGPTDRSHRETTPTSPSTAVSASETSLSPPPASTGLYRINSRQGLGRSPRLVPNLESPHDTPRQLQYGDVG